MSELDDLCHALLADLEARHAQGLVPCRPTWVNINELPGGRWSVTAWGSGPEGSAIAADIDVEAGDEAEALVIARQGFGLRTREEWLAEMPAPEGPGDQMPWQQPPGGTNCS